MIDVLWLIENLLWIAGLATLLAVGGYALYRGGPSSTATQCAYVGLALAGLGLSLTLTTWWLRGLWAIIAIVAFAVLVRWFWRAAIASRSRQRALVVNVLAAAPMESDDRDEQRAGQRSEQPEQPEQPEESRKAKAHQSQ